jgi:hypothetical protein
MIPEQEIILLSGIPATRKSTFARHLARERGFAHYDLECHPQGWPHPELKGQWEKDRAEFVRELRKHHKRVVLDWGFPPSIISWVDELRSQGVRLIWFEGAVVERAREVFLSRGGIRPQCFEIQVQAIKRAGYPTDLDCKVVEALSGGGVFMTAQEIENTVFGEKR